MSPPEVARVADHEFFLKVPLVPEPIFLAINGLNGQTVGPIVDHSDTARWNALCSKPSRHPFPDDDISSGCHERSIPESTERSLEPAGSLHG